MKLICRDLGHYLRNQVKQSQGIASATANDSHSELQLKSLENIANNVHFHAYPRLLKSTSTGLTKEQCSQVLSSEFLEYIGDEKKK